MKVQPSQNKVESYTTRAVNYAKAYPLRAAGATAVAVGTLALLAIGVHAAWNVSVVCEGSKTFCGKAQFKNRASAGFNAAADAAKNAAGATASAAKKAAETVGNAASSAAESIANKVSGLRPTNDPTCLVLGSDLKNTTNIILENNCARPGFRAAWFGAAPVAAAANSTKTTA